MLPVPRVNIFTNKFSVFVVLALEVVANKFVNKPVGAKPVKLLEIVVDVDVVAMDIPDPAKITGRSEITILVVAIFPFTLEVNSFVVVE